MIQDYKIKNGNILIYDDKKGFINCEYQDNIDEILIQENVIEKLIEDINKTKFDKIQDELHFNNNYSKKSKLITAIFNSSISLILSFLVFYSVPLFALILATLASIITNGVLFLADLEPKIELKNKINASTVEVEQLEKLLEKEQEKLNFLKNNKQKSKLVNKPHTFKERNKERLEEIDNLKELYRMCGYYAKKLLRYQEKGILKDKVDKSYTDDDLIIIENIIKEKGPQLVKRRNTSK